MSKINAADFTSEKNLWDVFLLSKRLTISKSHIIILTIVAVLLFLNAFFVVDNTSKIASETRAWAVIGFNFSIATIGPLIAGFTIFATLSKPDMMIEMMAHINTETKMPTLKYNLMAFMKVFISFVTLTFVYFGIMMFAQDHGLVVGILNIFPYAEIVKRYISIIGYVLTGTSLVYLLLTLKTFIFNIYAIVMASIRWEYLVSTPKNSEPEIEDKINN
ncbi:MULTISPECIES: hypothetical protein [Serratia]|uniref:hypothetical protein n=1 Tax=Serratia TaxID=613 RepID=UPI000CE293E5|nr:hypothetical protein [Serratia marcescens]AVD62414.1 hypothetical protein C4B62_04010 [Serratia marcescens]ELL0332380.1 hypothetical protein [Serratia marcescens]MBH2548937.1 hypothetical protein [Serratia marcescens]